VKESRNLNIQEYLRKEISNVILPKWIQLHPPQKGQSLDNVLLKIGSYVYHFTFKPEIYSEHQKKLCY
jgi:hypothetical protein